MTGVDKALPKFEDHRVHLEVDGVGVSLVMCVRHSLLSLSEIPASTTRSRSRSAGGRGADGQGSRAGFLPGHVPVMFRSSSQGKSR